MLNLSPNARQNNIDTIPYDFSGTQDPTAVATEGNEGAVYRKTTTPVGLFQKLDDGVTTNWAPLGGSSAPSIAVVGTYAAPITTDGTAPIVINSAADRVVIFIASTGGAVVMAPSSPITNPSKKVGQIYQIIGTSDADSVQFNNSANWSQNGPRVFDEDTTRNYIVVDTTTPKVVDNGGDN